MILKKRNKKDNDMLKVQNMYERQTFKETIFGMIKVGVN